jgi:DNA-directed RNA polymerase subunit M/transcription elongation factor TFIIS
MPIKFQCSCGQVLNVPDEKAGKSGKCPKCQKTVQIPSASAKSPSSTANPTAKAASSGGQSTPAKASTSTQAVVPTTAAKPAPVPAAKLDSLFEEAGLKKKSGPTCPKCGAAYHQGSAMCVQCGLNFETGEQSLGFNAAIEQQEFKNEFLQEAAENMKRDVVMDERRDKSGIPWWMILSYLVGAITLGAAGIIIVDGRLGVPAAEGSLMGNLQRLPVFTILGATLMVTGQFIHFFAHMSIVVFGFRKSIGAGFGCLLVPFFSYVFGIMNWADNKSAIMAIVTSLATIGLGIGLILSAGGFGLLQQALIIY